MVSSTEEVRHTAGDSIVRRIDDLAKRIADLPSQSTDKKPETPKLQAPRMFSVSEITKFIIPLTPAHFRKTIKQNPRLPQGNQTVDKGNLWFKLEDVITLKKHFSKEQSKTQSKIYTFANARRGTGKSSIANNFAQLAVLDGKKVLIIDLCSSQKITLAQNIASQGKSQTVYNIFANSYINYLKEQNKVRISRGENPIPLDNFDTETKNFSVSALIQTTPWKNIDIIPANLFLQEVNQNIFNWKIENRGWRYWTALKDILQSPDISDNYDSIIVDTGSSMDCLTISAIIAADKLLITTKADREEIEATKQYIMMLDHFISDVEEAENKVARAIGEEERFIEWESIGIILNALQKDNYMSSIFLAKESFGSILLESTIPEIDFRKNGPDLLFTILDLDPKTIGREEYDLLRKEYNHLYKEIAEMT